MTQACEIIEPRYDLAIIGAGGAGSAGPLDL
jgi:hypothetical protein